jgi:hypothetical protein
VGGKSPDMNKTKKKEQNKKIKYQISTAGPGGR